MKHLLSNRSGSIVFRLWCQAGFEHDAESAKALALDGERLRLASGFFSPLHQYFELVRLGIIQYDVVMIISTWISAELTWLCVL